MKICILTQYYPPEVGAPQARLSHLAKSLVARGHLLTVLTAMPNYPKGKIFPGYGGLLKQDLHEGIKIIHCLVYPTKSASFGKRMLNYFSFVFSSALVGTFIVERQDYILVESPPLFLGISGTWLSWIKQARMVFNVSDLWPETALHITNITKRSVSFRLSKFLEHQLYRLAWLVSGQSDGIIRHIRERIPQLRTQLFSNGSNCDVFHPDRRSERARAMLGPETDCIVLYAGLHGLAQGLDQVLDVAERLKHNKNLRFILVGDGPEKAELEDRARTKELTNILFRDAVPAEEVPELLASADVVLVPLKTYIPGAVPSKLYEGMASSRPIIFVGKGDAAELVTRHQVGLVVSPGDITGLAQALELLSEDKNLQEHFGKNGRKLAECQFNRHVISAKFVEFLEQEISDSTSHAYKLSSYPILEDLEGPYISIVIPCRNEIHYIETFLSSLSRQSAAKSILEIIVADGMSTDGTSEVVERFALNHPKVKILKNCQSIVSSGLNAAIRISRGKLILRMDVHTEYSPDYVAKCIEIMSKTGAENVGGPALTKGETLLQKSFAAAFHSAFALGGARFRNVEYQGLTSTVPYGCWPRSLFEEIGFFDEDLVRNQDDEFNLRLIRAGGRIWQSPEIKSWYYPRKTLSATLRQYFEYGYWKVAIMKKYQRPGSIRQVIPSLFLLGLSCLAILSLFFETATWGLVGIGLTYFGISLIASIIAAKDKSWQMLPLLPLVFGSFHLSYGLGFLSGIYRFFIQSFVDGQANRD